MFPIQAVEDSTSSTLPSPATQNFFRRTLSNASLIRATIFAASLALTFHRYKKAKNHYELQLSSSVERNNRTALLGVTFDRNEYVELLREFISHSKNLQNNPSAGQIPQEDLIANHIEKFLAPYSTAADPKSSLSVKKCTYVDGRSNLILSYKGLTDNVISFVGSHMDVVPANEKEWSMPPFELTVDPKDSDKVYGRGTTDCLGHVALLVLLMKQLAMKNIQLKNTIISVLIANEENSSILGVGIDEMMKRDELTVLKNGPLYWLDSANLNPTIGTGGINTWKLTAVGKTSHSGFPHTGINALSLANEAISYIQHRFYSDFPKHEKCSEYKYLVGSSFKPTKIATPPNQGITQIPRICVIEGDCRFVAFDDIEKIKKKIALYVDELNNSIIRNGRLRSHGDERFVLPEENIQGFIQFEWTGHCCPGVAVDLNSVGYKALCDSTYKVHGEVKPFSLTGSLPIIADLKAAGFDVSICGYGDMSVYHAVDEYCRISGMEKGFNIITNIIETLDQNV